MDVLGGHAAEQSAYMQRHNDITGASFIWEQENYDPVTRHIHAYITLKDPDTKKVLHASSVILSLTVRRCEVLYAAMHV